MWKTAILTVWSHGRRIQQRGWEKLSASDCYHGHRHSISPALSSPSNQEYKLALPFPAPQTESSRVTRRLPDTRHQGLTGWEETHSHLPEVPQRGYDYWITAMSPVALEVLKYTKLRIHSGTESNSERIVILPERGDPPLESLVFHRTLGGNNVCSFTPSSSRYYNWCWAGLSLSIAKGRWQCWQ